MGAFVARQPNGLLCRFSTVTDCPTHYNMTEEEYIETCVEKAKEEAKDVLEHFLKPFSWVKDYFVPNNMTKEEFEKLLKEMESEVKIEHDGCKGCRYENESSESSYCQGCKQNATDKYKRMTNGDKIRNMSDEELAKFIQDCVTKTLMSAMGDVSCGTESLSPDVIAVFRKQIREWLEGENEIEE